MFNTVCFQLIIVNICRMYLFVYFVELDNIGAVTQINHLISLVCIIIIVKIMFVLLNILL